MGTKGLSVNQVKMFCDMVSQKFQPLFDLAQEKRNAKKAELQQSLMVDLGISGRYEKFLALQADTERVKNQILSVLTANGFDVDHWATSFTEKLNRTLNQRVDKVMESMPDSMDTLISEQTELCNRIKLATVGGEITDIFKEIDAKFAELANKL